MSQNNRKKIKIKESQEKIQEILKLQEKKTEMSENVTKNNRKLSQK